MREIFLLKNGVCQPNQPQVPQSADVHLDFDLAFYGEHKTLHLLGLLVAAEGIWLFLFL